MDGAQPDRRAAGYVCDLGVLGQGGAHGGVDEVALGSWGWVSVPLWSFCAVSREVDGGVCSSCSV